MVKALLDKQAPWLIAEGPDAEVALSTECSVARNLSDFAFPARCSEDERSEIEDRVLGAIGRASFNGNGQYWSIVETDPTIAGVLAERGLVPAASLEASGPRGVYVSGDQSVSVVINGEDHVSIRARASGLQLRETWARVNAIDDDLSRSLNYAFHERLGYLTASIGKVGTGLEAAVVLHLSGLAMSGDRVNLDEAAAKREIAIGSERCVMDLLYNGFTNCFRAANRSTLGRSEEETLLHLKHLVGELVAWEKETRQRSLSEDLPRLEDSVARALGVARSARLMEFDEAAALVSSLRLGVATGIIKDYSLAMLDQLLLDAQPCHLRLRTGRNCDEATLSEERAKLFRARFSQ